MRDVSNLMELKRMYVDSNYRNLGIASKLLACLEEWCQKHNYQIILGTTIPQQDAINFYFKKGYKSLGTAPINHLTEEILMLKSLEKKKDK